MWVPLIAWGLARADCQRRAAGDPLAQLLAGLVLGVVLWQAGLNSDCRPDGP